MAPAWAEAEDLQKVDDERLLEMLGNLAKGATDDDQISGHLLEQPPLEVWEEEPANWALLQECGTLWEEVQAEAEVKQELHARLLGELRQIQDRSDRQYHESTCLMNRLMSAKQMLAEKLREASYSHQDLKDRISDEWRGNELLCSSMSQGFAPGAAAARAAQLSREILDCGEAQSKLAEELQAATEAQAHLQSELQVERVHTWRQSTDVVMAFARGSTGNSPMRRAAVPTSPVGSTEGMASTPSASSCRPQGVPGEDLHMELWTERSSWLRARVAGSEEQAEFERRCWRQAQRIEELSKELALEEASKAQLDAQLEDMMARANAFGIELSRVCHMEDEEEVPRASLEEWQDDLGFNIAGTLREVEQLRRELQEKEAECRRATEEQRKAQDALQAEQDELDSLRTRLVMGEAECDGHTRRLMDANVAVDLLRSEVQSEQAVLNELEQSASSKRERLRAQVQDHRAELARISDFNEWLAVELNNREAAAVGCFRRRAAQGGPARADTSQRGSPGRGGRGSPPPGAPSGARSPPGGGQAAPGKGGGKRSHTPPGGSKGGKGGRPGLASGPAGRGGPGPQQLPQRGKGGGPEFGLAGVTAEEV